MHIMLLGQHFWPEEVSGAVLATQTADSLVQRGHEVTFVTSFPSYPKGVVFDGYRGKFYGREIHDGATVIRSWSYTSPQKTTFRRLFNYGTFSATVFFAGLSSKRPDIIMSYSPPLPLGLTAWALSRLWRVPWILRLGDIFPEAAVSAGVIRNPFLIRALEAAERFQYRHAAHVSVLSEGFRQKLLNRGVPDKKMSVIPVWSDPGEIKPLSKKTAFRKEHGFEDKFIVLYSGNIGYTCALEDALDAAERLKDNHGNIHFVLIGEGTKKQTLIQSATDRQLTNLTFLPFQPREKYPEVLASADVTLVTLNADSATTSLPVKTFSYLAAARPVIAVTPTDSDLGKIIHDSGSGVVVLPGMPESLAQALIELKDDEAVRIRMGQRGRALLEERFSRERCIDSYLEIFNGVISPIAYTK